MRTPLVSLLIFCFMAACGRVPVPVSSTPFPAPTASATSPIPTQHATPHDLRIWVTPRFDPARDTLLQARLDAFAAEHGGLKIDVRVKEEYRLIESLRLTTFAAPAAAPDLITLSRPDLEAAVPERLIQPLDAALIDEEAWHPLARSLGQVNHSVYGLPFALDALALATSPGEEPSLDWGAISDAGSLAFNINDASFPLALYLSAGGELSDADGRSMLDETTLTRVLTLFASGNYLVLESDAQVASAWGQGSAAAVGWSSSFLTGGGSNVPLEGLPGLDEPSATLVTSWGWSVTSTDVQRRGLALELVKWLTAEEFLGEWISSLGYLPARLDARWKPLLDPARPVPPAELVEAVSPILREAVLGVLNGVSPEAAALAALEKFK